MKPTNRTSSLSFLLFFLFIFVGSFQTLADDHQSTKKISPLFWQLEFNGVKSYALGSIHLGNPSMYPLPAAIMSGFKASEALAVEVNLSDDSNALMTRLSQQYGMDAKRPLVSWLSPSTKKLYNQYCQKQGLPCQQFRLFKPWLVSVTFASFGFMKSGYDPELGIDRFFISEASKSKKSVISLETAESQFKLFADLSESLQEELLLQSMSENSDDLKLLIDSWSQGDEDKLVSLFEEVENPALKKVFIEQMLIKRNHKMADGVQAQLKLGKRVFVVVGTAHLVGKDNVLTLLQKHGVKVTKQAL